MKKILVPQELKVKESPTIEFLTHLENIDQKIVNVRYESRVVMDELSIQKELFAVNKFKHKSVTDELESLKVKYQLLVTQHGLCK